MAQKTAVVLFNLGGPDSREAIRPFLTNFFMDPNIIRLPYPFRWALSRSIASRRTKNEAGDSYAELGGKSPLLENTQAQADALESFLGDGFKCFVSMRYWHPMAPQVVQQVKEWAPEKIVFLPLYPQYSTTTTRSSLQQWVREAKKAGLAVPFSGTCCYPQNKGFVDASARLVREAYEAMDARRGEKNLKPVRVLFSAHGLPEDVVTDGDPYQWQCEESAKTIAKATGIANLDWQICYQSRVGPKKWIGPSTEEALEKAAKDDVPVLVYPHAFVNEHVETLVEIEIEYREIAEKLGVPLFERVPTVGTEKEFIEGLASLVRETLLAAGVVPEQGSVECPSPYRRCCLRDPLLKGDIGGHAA